jgi:hypothetical protein
MPRPTRLVQILIGALVFLALPCRGADRKGVVEGRVLDAQGKPVSGATVEIGNTDGGWPIPIAGAGGTVCPSAREPGTTSRSLGGWGGNPSLEGSCSAPTVQNLHKAKTNSQGYYRIRAPEMTYQTAAFRTCRADPGLTPVTYGQVEIHAGQTVTQGFVLIPPAAPGTSWTCPSLGH